MSGQNQTMTLGTWTFFTPDDPNAQCGAYDYRKFTSDALYGRGRLGGGKVGAMVMQSAMVSCSNVRLEKAGLYELSFRARGRASFVGQEVEVYWNDLLLTTLKTETTDWVRFALPILALKDGELGTLLFRGRKSKTNLIAFIDDVSLRRVRGLSISDGSVLPEGVAFDLADDAKIGLAFDGEVTVSEFRRAGQKVRGTDRIISAETCPEWVSGPGRLKVAETGLIIVVR